MESRPFFFKAAEKVAGKFRAEKKLPPESGRGDKSLSVRFGWKTFRFPGGGEIPSFLKLLKIPVLFLPEIAENRLELVGERVKVVEKHLVS